MSMASNYGKNTTHLGIRITRDNKLLSRHVKVDTTANLVNVNLTQMNNVTDKSFDKLQNKIYCWPNSIRSSIDLSILLLSYSHAVSRCFLAITCKIFKS